MLDQKKIKILKIAGYVVLLILTVFVGVGLGQSFANPSAEQEGDAQTEVTALLTEEEVHDFLLNYYTKKDLGENRQRYKDFMTSMFYEKTVAEEEKPLNQTYKGFVIDFEYKEADIYINQSDLVVIAQVQYVNTLLDEKKNYDTAQKDILNDVTLRISYVRDGNTFKVSNMESIILTDQMGDYGKLDQSKEETKESSSSSSSKEEKKQQ